VRARLVEQSQRRQFTGLRRIEQQHLALFSARSLLATAGAGASMRGGMRARSLRVSASPASMRACLRSRPSFTSRVSCQRSAGSGTRAIPRRPVRLPPAARKSQTPRRRSRPTPPENSSVAPSSLRPAAARCPRPGHDAAGALAQDTRTPVQRGQSAAARQQRAEGEGANRGVGPAAALPSGRERARR